MKIKNNALGFTLMELLLSVAILGILSGVAMPIYSNITTKTKFASESEKILRYLTYARSEAVAHNTDITVSFTTGADWCVGLSDSGACDCSTANSCQINTIEKVIGKASNADFSLAVDNALQNANFDPQRGMLEKTNAPSSGKATLSGSSLSSEIEVNILGRADLCSSDLSTYNDCPSP